MRFFQRPHTKTVLHGLAAWTLYSGFGLIERLSGGDKPSGFANIIFKNFIHGVCIPTISVIGVEDIVHKVYDTPFDINLAVFNTIGAMSSLLLSTFSLPTTESNYIVPLTLYSFSVLSWYCGNDAPFALVRREEQPEQGYRIS